MKQSNFFRIVLPYLLAAAVAVACDESGTDDGLDAGVAGNGGSTGSGQDAGSAAGGAGGGGGFGAAGTGGVTPNVGGLVGTSPPVHAGYKLDVLFVVGRTASMGSAQERLAVAIPNFLAELSRRKMDDVQVGVVTGHMGIGGTRYYPGDPLCSLSVGDQALLQSPQRCGLAGTPFLQLKNGRPTNAEPDAASSLSCLVRVGTEGCVWSMPLGATINVMKMFAKENAGFLRGDADLLIIVVSDEDDCSAVSDANMYTMVIPGQFRHFRCATAGHMCDFKVIEAKEMSVPLGTCDDRPGAGDQLIRVQDVMTEFATLKMRKTEDRRFEGLDLPPPRVMFAALSGWPAEADLPNASYTVKPFESSNGPLLDLAPVCGQGPTAARPGLRLRAIAKELGADGLFLPVCDDDLAPALVRVAGLP